MRPTTLALCLLAACEVVPHAGVRGPRAPWSSLTEAERADVYRRYRLGTQRSGLGTVFAREDGTHGYIEMRDVLAEYPRSRALYERARTRDETLAWMAISGVSILFTAGRGPARGAGRGAPRPSPTAGESPVI